MTSIWDNIALGVKKFYLESFKKIKLLIALDQKNVKKNFGNILN